MEFLLGGCWTNFEWVDGELMQTVPWVDGELMQIVPFRKMNGYKVYQKILLIT